MRPVRNPRGRDFHATTYELAENPVCLFGVLRLFSRLGRKLVWVANHALSGEHQSNLTHVPGTARGSFLPEAACCFPEGSRDKTV